MVLVLELSGCASTFGPETAWHPVPGTPDWVGGGTLKPTAPETGKPALYGVVAVSSVRNAALAWETAENMARAQLVKQVQREISVARYLF